MTAQIVTGWEETASGLRQPTLLSAHPLPAGASLMDATGQQALLPDPNSLTVEVWQVPLAWLDAVEASNPGSVLWSKEDAPF